MTCFPVFEHITWDQAWEMLTKMACNPECTEQILVSGRRFPQPGVFQRFLAKFCGQVDDSAEKDALDSHLGGLLHQVLLVSAG